MVERTREVTERCIFLVPGTSKGRRPSNISLSGMRETTPKELPSVPYSVRRIVGQRCKG